MRFRLSVLMFLQWAVPGAVVPYYTVHLEQHLGFAEMTTALCCATQAVATVLSSLVAGQVADRWVSAEKTMAACAALAGADLWLLAGLRAPGEVFAATLGFWVLAGPMLLMGTTITFSHLQYPSRDFGPVRLWGTVGWMAVGWAVGGAMAVGVMDAFRVGAVTAWLLAAYTATLPPTPPREVPVGARSWLAPLAAMRLLRQPALATYCAVALGMCITFPFSTQATPLLLQRLGLGGAWLGPALTVAQVTEVAALALLPRVTHRLGLRATMALGLAAWGVGMAALAVGWPAWLVVASLGLHGVYVTGFLIAGQVYVNGLAADDVRASAQGLVTFVNGVGMLVGNLLAGGLRSAAGGELQLTFAAGAGITGVMLAVFLAGPREGQAADR